jgi:UDP-N-acetylglucosamine--N-acetylmuramyl-(pentapeptide) pyrophosphoryl-undecaprenol N-acetylglucosamine transferase
VTARILLYAVNGRGLGHLTRLVAIARWLRRLGPFVGGVQLCFITTSEADHLLWQEGFTSFKVPSRAGLPTSDSERAVILSMARQAVTGWISNFAPDVLVVDTIARGAFGELPGVMESARRRVLVTRQMRALSPDVAQATVGYDRLLLTEDAPTLDGAPAGSLDRCVTVGPVLRRESVELLSRASARKALGIPHHASAVLVTSGGGGDTQQLGALASVLEAHSDAHIVVAAGPLHRSGFNNDIPRTARVQVMTDVNLADHLRAFDLAVSAGGMNALHELHQAEVFALVRPQDRELDDQEARGRRLAECGAGAVLPKGTSLLEVARAVVDALGRSFPPSAPARRNDARICAAHILSEICPPRKVADALAIFDGDALLQRGASERVESSVAVAVALEPRNVTGAFSHAHNLLSRLADEGLPDTTVVRLAQLLAVRMPVGSVADRCAAIADVGASLADFSDWPTAFAVVRALQPDREQPAVVWSRSLVDMLRQARLADLSLQNVLELMLQVHGLDGSTANNADAVASVFRAVQRSSVS